MYVVYLFHLLSVRAGMAGRRDGRESICVMWHARAWTHLVLCPDDQQLLDFDPRVCSPNLLISLIILLDQRFQLLVSLHNYQYTAFPQSQYLIRLAVLANPTHLVPLLTLYVQYILHLYNHLRLHPHGNGGFDNSLLLLLLLHHHQTNLSINNVRCSHSFLYCY